MSNQSKGFAVPFAIMSFLFFLLGYVTWINNMLVPFVKAKFSLPEMEAQLVSAAFFSAYILSIPMGGIVKKIGYKSSVILGSIITGIGSILFIFALGANVEIAYALILSSLFITAIGIVILQVVVNPYVIALGTPETSASRLTFATAINSAAAVLAPIIGNMLLSTDAEGKLLVTLENEQVAVIMYIVMASISILTGIAILFMNLPEIGNEADKSESKSTRSAWGYPHLILGFLAIGMYMGLEVGVGNYFKSYTTYNVKDWNPAITGLILGLYPLGFFVGRLLGAGILKKFEASKVLLVNSLICVFLLVLFFLTKDSEFSIWPLIAQGLFLSIMWSVLFDLSMKDIPASESKLASGIICTGVVFVGIWMYIMAMVVDSTGTFGADGKIDPATCNYGIAYAFFFFFYAYIIFFALKGAKIRKA